jgi:hypothetical protein
MATIVKALSKAWKAVIRRQGWPTVSKSFRTKRDAEDWARCTEDEMIRGVYVRRSPSETTTITAALKRYLGEVTPSKRPSTQRSEAIRAKSLQKHLGRYSLAALTPDSHSNPMLGWVVRIVLALHRNATGGDSLSDTGPGGSTSLRRSFERDQQGNRIKKYLYSLSVSALRESLNVTYALIAVGWPVARPPPYRSPHAELPHGAPQSYSLRTEGGAGYVVLRGHGRCVVVGA